MLRNISTFGATVFVSLSAWAQVDGPNVDARDVLGTAVALWEMNGVDNSGMGNDSRLRAVGVFDAAIRLDKDEAESSYAVGGNGAVATLGPGAFNVGQASAGEINLTGSAFTILTRVRKIGGSWNTTLLSKHGGQDKLQYNLFCFEMPDGSIDMGLEVGTQSAFAKVVTIVPENRADGWLDILGRYDGKYLELFINGERQSLVPLSGELRPASGSPLIIGGEWNGTGVTRRFSGMIDHAAIWDRPLSDDEIERVSNGWDGQPVGDRYRPAIRFSPERNWINDPNGMMYVDGTWHLFYQYNPFGDRWGHMSWGHATSTDLITWKHERVALQEQDGVMIFSGSAVPDVNNTSGLGRNGKGPLVAIYTGHHSERNRQDQRIAYSNDDGKTWTRYASNPVIDLDLKHHRDPKVFWHAQTSRWIMAVAVATSTRVQFWGSDDLKSWDLLSEFGPEGAVGVPNWECPELFELPIEGRPGESRWVLQIDVGNNGPAGGSAGQYFVGHFDGTRFVNENPPQTTLWVDYGADFYAAQSFTGVEGRRVWLAWMNDWRYAQDIPTYPWRGSMTMPREVGLRESPAGVRLFQRPAAEVRSVLSRSLIELKDSVVSPLRDPLDDFDIAVDVARVQVTFRVPDGADRFGLRVFEGAQEHTAVGYDMRLRELFVDRRKSGSVGFHDSFAAHHAAPLRIADDGTVTLDVLVDRSSVEVFGQDGDAVISDRVFPSPASLGVSLFSERGDVEVESLRILGR